jgi:hypothetical protein
MVLDSEEANEGVARAPLEIKVARSTKVSRAHFLHASIGLNEEMDNVEEIGGTNTQP